MNITHYWREYSLHASHIIEFFEYLSETHKEFQEKNEKDKIILLFHSKNKQTINKFAKFVYQSFQAKSKELTN